jgi:hypothetical protein
MDMMDTRSRLFYPTDPLGTVPGGVDTFVRGLTQGTPEEQRPKNAFFHQDPDLVRRAARDTLRRWLPGPCERLERKAFGPLNTAGCVRQGGVQRLRERDPATQEDPLRMVEAFVRLRAPGRAVQWLVIGGGVLKPEMQAALQAAGGPADVRVLGLQPAHCMADILPTCDTFGLSSVDEGMPRVLPEALGCGWPGVATGVGEVQHVVRDGINIRLLAAGDALSLAHVLDESVRWRGKGTARGLDPSTSRQVWAQGSACYRERGRPMAQLCRVSSVPRAWGSVVHRRQRPLLGVGVDAAELSDALARWTGGRARVWRGVFCQRALGRAGHAGRAPPDRPGSSRLCRARWRADCLDAALKRPSGTTAAGWPRHPLAVAGTGRVTGPARGSVWRPDAGADGPDGALETGFPDPAAPARQRTATPAASLCGDQLLEFGLRQSSDLRTVRARVRGAVMKRRRFHLPQRIYRML